MTSFNEELRILADAIGQLGVKGEVKLAEWIRGSSVSWTQAHNKKALSYGNNMGHTLDEWRLFMRQCHVLGVVKYDLRSMVKSNGHYSVMGIYHPLDSISEYVEDEKHLMLPSLKRRIVEKGKSSVSSPSSSGECAKKRRMGKGCNILPIVRKMLVDKEISEKND